LPERFGDFRVVHTRFSRWSKTGVWERVFQQLAADADNEYAMIDATIVRAHKHNAGAKGGGPEQEAIGRSTRWIEYQNSCEERCTWQPARAFISPQDKPVI